MSRSPWMTRLPLLFAGVGAAVLLLARPPVEPAVAEPVQLAAVEAERSADHAPSAEVARTHRPTLRAAAPSVPRVAGTGVTDIRADPVEEQELARINRELLLETSIGNLQAAARQAQAEGNPQRADLMLRRVDALAARLGELRSDPML